MRTVLENTPQGRRPRLRWSDRVREDVEKSETRRNLENYIFRFKTIVILYSGFSAM
jgi:hypothetical protein